MKTPTSNYDRQVDIARDIFVEYDQEFLIRKFHLEADEHWLYLTYLHMPCRICRKSGRVELFEESWEECRSFNTVMTIYDLLCYSKGEQMPALLGQWCAVGTFVVTGVTNTEGFTRKFAAYFDGRMDRLKAACQKMGGQLLPSMAGADLTCRIPVTPFFPVLLQFWAGDEEFPARLLILWDRNADQFLHFETTFYLQGDILLRLKDHTEN